ncbi:acyltransferase family protein [Cephaloticoccus capnophilus]|nr:acyltransferase [Cephaloticoccus capnophilus]
MSSNPQTIQRFSEVDGLRAVACGLVVISHAPDLFQGISQGGEWITHLRMGRLAVLMFFAISGFVIPSSLRGGRWEGVKRFALRRFWRLYPAYWLVLLMTCFWGFSYPIERLPWDATMLPSLRRFAGLGWAHGFLHFWTLEVELIFYITLAFLFMIFGRLRLRLLLFGYISLVLCTTWGAFPVGAAPQYSPIPSIMVMFWGAVCREILRFDFSKYTEFVPMKGVNWSRSLAIGLVTAPLVIIGLYYFIYGGSNEWGRVETRFGLSLLFAVIGFLFWVVLTPIRINWLSAVGRWTYSTYLFHFLIIIGVRNFIASNNPGGLSFILHGWPLPVYVVGLLVLCFAVGAVAYRWIEQPSDRVGKWLTAKNRS